MIVSVAGAERQGRRIGARSLTVRKLSESTGIYACPVVL
jgi:hypothetical protein